MITERPSIPAGLTGLPAQPGLRINVAGSVGTGPTEMAAFDAALRELGAAEYNLIRLSSIIPPRSVVSASVAPLQIQGRWGDRLYVVMAERRTSHRGNEAWAGIGWTQHAQLGQGLLAEHEGHSKTEVDTDLQLTLQAMRDGRGPAVAGFGDNNIISVGARCTGQPVCALVLAVFAAEPWSSPGGGSG